MEEPAPPDVDADRGRATQGRARSHHLRHRRAALGSSRSQPRSSSPRERVARLLDQLVAEYDKPEHGLSIREVAGGYKMATKAEHHEAVRAFVKNLKPPLKLSLPALETLAVIAYKQPITAPEIMEIRGVQGAGVLKTLLDRKLIATAGRKNVVGKPILYKTTQGIPGPVRTEGPERTADAEGIRGAPAPGDSGECAKESAPSPAATASRDVSPGQNRARSRRLEAAEPSAEA